MKTACCLLVLLTILLSCQSGSKQEEKSASTTATATSDSSALLSKRPAAGSSRSAADRLVRALYFEHNKKENPFREKKDRTLVDQFFAKPTADLIWKDTRRSSDKVNLLFDAPDAVIKKTWVEPAAIGGSRAIVYVTFENKARPEEIKIDLQQLAGRWRIVDMLYPNGKRLTQLLR